MIHGEGFKGDGDSLGNFDGEPVCLRDLGPEVGVSRDSRAQGGDWWLGPDLVFGSFQEGN